MEPRAIRAWTWVDDQTGEAGYDFRNFRFMRLALGDSIWPIDYGSGSPPTPRTDGNTWQYGQNLTTAKHGWHLAEHVTRPPEDMLHEAQRQGTLMTHPESSFTEDLFATMRTAANPSHPTPHPEETERTSEDTDNLITQGAPNSSNSVTTNVFHSSLEALNALAIPLPDTHRPGGNPQGGDASNDDTP